MENENIIYDDLRQQVAILFPYLNLTDKIDWCKKVAWVESGGRKDINGNITSPGSDIKWVSVSSDIYQRQAKKFNVTSP